jgi:small conductance mechanosensitive channel
MRRLALAGSVAVLQLTWLCVSPGPLAGQEPTETDHMSELLSRLDRLESRIGHLQTRYEDAEGEDRDLFADQLARRWREHHQLLGEMVGATEAVREAGAERPAATERIRGALDRETETLLANGEQVQEQITDLRVARPGTPPDELVSLELRLTDLNIELDELIVAAVDNTERAEIVGLDLDLRVGQVDAAIGDRAAVLAARIELARDQRAGLSDRLTRTGVDSVAIGDELDALEEKLFGTTTSLQTMVDLMNRRGLETSEYRRLLVEVTGDLGTNILDTRVVAGLMEQRWAAVREWLAANGGAIAVRVVTIVGVLFVFGILARLGRRAVERVVRSSRIAASELLKRLLINTISKLIWFMGFLVVLSMFGIDIGPMLAGLGIAGFVLGFALQDTLSNFAAGLMIMVYRPFDVEDIVTAGGVTGVVQAVTLVSTVITTFDNQLMIVPNSKVWGDVINNVTAEESRRVDLVFGIGYADDIDKAQRIMDDVVRSHDRVLEDPEPTIQVHNLGDSSVDFVCRPWCRTEDYWTVYWDVTRAVKERFDAEGISIPFPQRDVHVYQHGEADSASP